MAFANKHNLWVIEDCCDAVGSTYKGRPLEASAPGDHKLLSCAPHHDGRRRVRADASPALKKLVESFRDWGRDCWCDPGKSNTCGCRFEWTLGDLPAGYDHKYIYSHIGYNLKATDMQAAVGVAQLKKLPAFMAARRENFAKMHAAIKDLDDIFVLPEATANSDPCWFGFPLAVRADAPCTRKHVMQFLEARKIANPAAVRRKPATPAGLPRHPPARDRRIAKYRLRNEQRFLGRPVSGDHERNAPLHGGHFPPSAQKRRAGSITADDDDQPTRRRTR